MKTKTSYNPNDMISLFSVWDDWQSTPVAVANAFAATYWPAWPRKVENFNPKDCSFQVEDGSNTYFVVHVPSKYKNEVGKYEVIRHV